MPKSELRQGWDFLYGSWKILTARPVLLVPIFLAWLVDAKLTIYAKYQFNWPDSFGLICLYIYLMIFVTALSICVANLMMLEFVQDMENGKRVSFIKALKELIFYDFIKVIPIAAVWSVIWFVIVLLRTLKRMSRLRDDDDDLDDGDIREIAGTLGGFDDTFSTQGLTLTVIEDLVRMSVFMVLPAIAWENAGPFRAVSKAKNIIKKHPTQFLITYSLTEAAACFVFLPLIPIYFIYKFRTHMPDEFWVCVIFLIGFIWTCYIYLEQMAVGLMYLWHLKWVQNGGEGSLYKIPKPSILDAGKVKKVKNIAPK